MSGRIPENILEEILSRLDIVEIISSYLPLKKVGNTFKALCPFHHEKSASFMVSQEKQVYHCFGCGAGGNVFNFVMQYEKLEFPDAVEQLARKANVTLPRTTSKAETVFNEIFRINEIAQKFYFQNLQSREGEKARKYLIERGIKQDICVSMGLGYALKNWESLLDHLRNQGFSLALIEKSGLIIPRASGGYYDRFRDRIIFPILDVKARVLGFGARCIPGTSPADQDSVKYINSPETAVYSKGKNLYGLFSSKEAIRREDCSIVVEGYLDFIVPFSYGIENIVASLGTAITPDQVRLLKRYSENAVMLYDGDSAGQEAALRSLDIFIAEGMNVRFALLPPKHDPDSFVRKDGAEAFKNMLASSLDIIDFKMGMLERHFPGRTPQAKSKIAAAMLATVNSMGNAIMRSEYKKRLCQRLDIDPNALENESRKITQQQTRKQPAAQEITAEQVQSVPVERQLLKLMVQDTCIVDIIKRSLLPSDFRDPKVMQIVAKLFELCENRDITTGNLLLKFPGEETFFSSIACNSSLLLDTACVSKEKIVEDCISRIIERNIREKRKKLNSQIRQAQEKGDNELLYSLIEEFEDLSKKGHVKK